MKVVLTSPEERGRAVEVLQREDGLFTYRITPGSSDPIGGIYDTPARALAEAQSSPAWLHPYEGMTTNERLFAAGILEPFDLAISHRDRSAAVALLQKTDLSFEAASSIVDRILTRR